MQCSCQKASSHSQEALANAVKHSGAKTLRVSLRRVDQNVTVSIRDDGVGFDVQLARARAMDAGSVGLLTMRERAVLAGGLLKIDSSLQRGTCVCASFSAEHGARQPQEAVHSAPPSGVSAP